MHKTRRLTVEDSVSFQMFLILLSFIKFCFRKSNFCVQAMSQQYLDVCFYCLFVRGGGGGMRRSQNLECALRSVQFLASFISFNFEILSYLACGEKIIRIASKNSVKLAEKSASDF